MGKYFGTDGVRGVVNVELDAMLAFQIGRAAAYVLQEQSNRRAKILIGKDTRISSDMLEAALTAGICSSGVDVELLGAIPTPAVAYLTIKHGAAAGIVISASHNPYEYNGIKIFAGNGYKLNDELEARIEQYIDNTNKIPRAVNGNIGRILQSDIDPVEEYTDHLAETIKGDLHGLRIAVDCANGAASTTAKVLFRKLKADASFRYFEPDGVNINLGCGSTHLEPLQERMRIGEFDCGIAFDGDADRCLVVDDKGEVLDGDRIMAVCAVKLKNEGHLRGNAFVATVMSNKGLYKYAASNGIDIVCANVGDRYVLEKMLENGYCLGGEQSGHVIFLEHASTGDGELTAIQFLSILRDSGKRASEIASEVMPWPQLLVNVAVPNAQKATIAQHPVVKEAIEQAESKLGGGRILVRPSGTEALVRVMVEAEDAALVEETCHAVADVIRSVQ